MDISALKKNEWPSPNIPGVVWTYRVPGIALKNELRQMAARPFAGEKIQAGKLNTDALMSAELNIEVLTRISADMAMTAFRTCVLSVTGLEVDGLPVDLGRYMTEQHIGGFNIKALSDAVFDEIGVGPVADDIADIGIFLRESCSLSESKKKS